MTDYIHLAMCGLVISLFNKILKKHIQGITKVDIANQRLLGERGYIDDDDKQLSEYNLTAETLVQGVLPLWP